MVDAKASTLTGRDPRLSTQHSELSTQHSTPSTQDSHPRPPLIIIGSGEDFTILELAEMVKQVVGYSGKLIFDVSRPDGTPRKLLDVSKLLQLGWKPRMRMYAGIKLAYADYLSSLVRNCDLRRGVL